MIRKVVIVGLTALMCMVGGLWVLSSVNPSAYSLFWGSDAWVEIGVVNGDLDVLILHGVGRSNTRTGTHVAVLAVGNLRRQRGISATHRAFRTSTVPAFRASGCVVPLWCLFILASAVPTSAFMQGSLRRWRRGKRGHCLTCGYNLTGLTEPRCPECGTGFTLPNEMKQRSDGTAR